MYHINPLRDRVWECLFNSNLHQRRVLSAFFIFVNIYKLYFILICISLFISEVKYIYMHFVLFVLSTHFFLRFIWASVTCWAWSLGTGSVVVIRTDRFLLLPTEIVYWFLFLLIFVLNWFVKAHCIFRKFILCLWYATNFGGWWHF